MVFIGEIDGAIAGTSSDEIFVNKVNGCGMHIADSGGQTTNFIPRCNMQEKQTIERTRRDKEQGKAATTQAGEFIREEMHHIREGKHGARSTKQAIAIGLSKARRSGVDLKPPAKG
jgi:hypothetical protein